MIEKIESLLKDCSIELSDLKLLQNGIILKITRGSNLEKKLEEVYSYVKDKFPKYLHDSILYLLGELIDNINQHSNYSQGSVFIGYDKDRKEILVLVYDDGVSIPKSFDLGKISFRNDNEAIEMAMKGKSTKKEVGRGFGLSSTVKIIEKGFKGKLVIASRDGIYKTSETSHERAKKINGTFVFINFHDTGEGLNIYEYLT